MDRNFSSNMCFACDSTFRYWTSSTFYIEVSNSIQKLRTTSYYNRLYLDVGVYQSNSKLKIIYIKEILLAFCLCDFQSGSIQVSDERGMTQRYSNTGSFFSWFKWTLIRNTCCRKSNILAHVYRGADAVLKRNGVDQKMGKVFE